MATARQLNRRVDHDLLEAALPSQRVRSRVLHVVQNVVPEVSVAVNRARDVDPEADFSYDNITDRMLLNLYQESMRGLQGSSSSVRGMGKIALAGVEEYLMQRGIITDDRYDRILWFKGTGLDARVHISIPREKLGALDYKTWVDKEVITPWLVGQEKNPQKFVRELKWNEVVYVSPKIKGIERHVGIFKADGNGDLPAHYHFSVGRQGVHIQQDYTLETAERVHFVADSLEATLKREGIEYERHNKRR